MRIFCLILLFCIPKIWAQDRIITVGGDTINCRIISVGQHIIQYEKSEDAPAIHVRTSYRRMPVSPCIYANVEARYATPLFKEIAGQARNDAATKSRRDDTLLTVGFNLRQRMNVHARQSPAGTTLCRSIHVSSLRDFAELVDSFVSVG